MCFSKVSIQRPVLTVFSHGQEKVLLPHYVSRMGKFAGIFLQGSFSFSFLSLSLFIYFSFSFYLFLSSFCLWLFLPSFLSPFLLSFLSLCFNDWFITTTLYLGVWREVRKGIELDCDVPQSRSRPRRHPAQIPG